MDRPDRTASRCWRSDPASVLGAQLGRYQNARLLMSRAQLRQFASYLGPRLRPERHRWEDLQRGTLDRLICTIATLEKYYRATLDTLGGGKLIAKIFQQSNPVINYRLRSLCGAIGPLASVCIRSQNPKIGPRLCEKLTLAPFSAGFVSVALNLRPPFSTSSA